VGIGRLDNEAEVGRTGDLTMSNCRGEQVSLPRFASITRPAIAGLFLYRLLTIGWQRWRVG
jgi:hypothetical protein